MLSIGGASTNAGGAPFANAETVMITGQLVSVPKDSVFCVIIAQVQMVLDASVTAMHLRLRRGGATGTVVQDQTSATVTGGQNALLTFMGNDIISGLAQVQYTLSAQGVGAVGNNAPSLANIAYIFLQ